MKEKKEIWKLIELLNEYDTEIMKSETRPRATYKWKLSCCWYDMHEVSSDLLGYLIISKQFRFIKWLVENDKIDTNNLSLKAFKNIFSGGWFVEVSDLEVLLMLLSISDTPIDDLISYLK